LKLEVHMQRSLVNRHPAGGLLALRGVLVLALVAASAAQAQAPAAPPARTTAQGTSAPCPPLLNVTLPRLQDEKPQSLCQYSGQVLLVVNTASHCGFTGQYKGLEDLYARYRQRGLVVLGFPSNDFAQEKGSNQEIAEFCENTFGVRFPMFAASSVRGEQANPLFRQLIAQGATAPKWNFYKYLVGRDGRLVESYSSMTSPDSRSLVAAIERHLKAP
jgi:glutathione peroxidase